MECPCCGQERPKKFWTKGQWASYRAYCNGYIGCRSCREDTANGMQRHSYLQKHVAAGLASCLDELCHHVASHAEATFQWDAFMEAWERDVLRETRKDLSHYGALPSTLPWEPRLWTPGDADSASWKTMKEASRDANSAPEARDWYFDAGNDVYAFSIQLLFPHATSTKRHNSNYLGDVLEAILGLCWLCHDTTSLAMLLVRASKYVYGLKSWLALDSFDHSQNRQAVYRYIAEHSCFRTDGKGSAPRDLDFTSHSHVHHAWTGEHERFPVVGTATSSDVALPAAWFEDFEREYLKELFQKLHLHTGAPALLAICDETYDVPADTTAEQSSHIDDAAKRVMSKAHGPIIFALQDVAAFRDKQGGSTRSAHNRLRALRSEHEEKLMATNPGFHVDLSSEEWWKIWLCTARFAAPLEDILGDGVVQFLFEAFPWIDPNTPGRLRTDFTLVTRRHRVRLHPSGKGAEAKPVFVEHEQEFLPRGTIAQSTCPHQRHIGLSQHDLMSDKQAWSWASQQTSSKDLTCDLSFGWERWVCHAAWAKDLVVLNFGLAFPSEFDDLLQQVAHDTPHFWCRAMRGTLCLYLTIVRKAKKTVVYPISCQRYEQLYASLLVRSGRTSYYS